jgi:hypothetical protein
MNHLSDKDLITKALGLWANYVETGDVCMSSVDAANCGLRNQVKVLTDEQKRFVARLRDLQVTSRKIEIG